ncbi:MAG: phosphate ABC transporter permease PstA [Myxococcota bacterium]
MSELPESGDRWASPAMQKRLKRRQQQERLFRRCGVAAVAVALGSLFLLLGNIVWNGTGAFWTTEIRVEVDLEGGRFAGVDVADEAAVAEAIDRASFRRLARDGLYARFPDVRGRKDKRSLAGFLSRGAGTALEERVRAEPSLVGRRVAVWLPADDELDLFHRYGADAMPRFGESQVAWADALERAGSLRSVFNRRFLSSGDSREPELAGIWGALVGSFLMLSVTLALVLPLGIAAAVYLEEFAPRNGWTELIEVNINNLAAVPSIVFGLLGLALFLNVAQFPRSAPLVGGLTLALMTFSTIIITGRVSIQAVPQSTRDAALGVGASPLQVVLHHVLPQAMPGILTGTIIGMARALGETAPLLMIGMVAFVVDIPGSVTDASTALPVQIFLWSDSPERAFVEKTSGAILILLLFLVSMNATAIWLRRRFESNG